jgi:hypothetical protein
MDNSDAVSQRNKKIDTQMYLACGTFAAIPSTGNSTIRRFKYKYNYNDVYCLVDDHVLHKHIKINKNSKVAYVQNAKGNLCTLSHLNTKEAADVSSNSNVQLHKYPSFMKIHQSLLSYLTSSMKVPSVWSSTTRKHMKVSSHKASHNHDLIAEGSILSIHVSPISLANGESLRYELFIHTCIYVHHE